MRKEYYLNDEDYEFILNACQPSRYMIIGNYMPKSPQENANEAWKILGNKYGFDSMSVLPCDKGARYFTAEENNK